MVLSSSSSIVAARVCALMVPTSFTEKRRPGEFRLARVLPVSQG